MSFFHLLNREQIFSKKFLFLIAVAGIADASIIWIINSYLQESSLTDVNITYFVFFVVVLAIMFVSSQQGFQILNLSFEKIAYKIRIRVSKKICRLNPIEWDRLEKNEIYNRLTQDLETFTLSKTLFCNFLQGFVTIVFLHFLLAFQSFFLFMLIFVQTFLFMGVIIYSLSRLKISSQEISAQESRILEIVNYLMQGFKEVKINQKRKEHLFKDLKTELLKSEEMKKNFKKKEAKYLIAMRVYATLIAGLTLFIVSFFLTTTHVLMFVVTSILFYRISCYALFNFLVRLPDIDTSVSNMVGLEKKLNKYRDSAVFEDLPTPFAFADKITLENVAFSYPVSNDREAFQIKPTSLEIKKGQVFFIVGNNGEGKSTLIKLLSGLYYPSSGILKLDDMPITSCNVQKYRELLSIIFADFCLFPKVYGSNAPEKKIQELLEAMNLHKATEYKEGRFTNLKLSTGQKKRLALLISLLEDKPVYVFDEIASDQDPGFKKYFYEQLIGDLKNKGKTVIIASHDTKYFSIADQIVEIKQGMIQAFTR